MGKDDATVLPKGFNSLKEGAAVQTKVTGKPFDYTFAPREDYYLKAHLFGDIFASVPLTPFLFSQRNIIIVVFLLTGYILYNLYKWREVYRLRGINAFRLKNHKTRMRRNEHVEFEVLPFPNE